MSGVSSIEVKESVQELEQLLLAQTKPLDNSTESVVSLTTRGFIQEMWIAATEIPGTNREVL